MAPLSHDLRVRLARAVDAGGSARQVAARFDVSPSTVVKLMQRVRATGSVEPARIGGYRKPLLAAHEATIRELVAANGSITLAELQGGHHRTWWPGSIALGGLVDAAAARAQAQKKSLRAAEQNRPDVAKARRRWRGFQGFMDPDRFVFLDETGASTNMVRRSGLGAEVRAARRPHPARTLEDDDVRRRPPGVGDRCAAGAQRADERADLPRLCRAVPRAVAVAGRRRGDGQPRGSQGRRRARGDRRCRRQRPLPAALQLRTSTRSRWPSLS